VRFVAPAVVCVVVAACSGASVEAPIGNDTAEPAPRGDVGTTDASAQDPSADGGVEAACLRRASSRCAGGHLYYFDSCGNFDEIKEICQHGCVGAACTVCEAHATSKCDGSNLYWYDGCGNVEGVKEICANGCVGSACTVCTSHATTKCSGNALHYADSCGKLEELKEQCPGTCSGGACAPKVWRCANAPAVMACFCLMSADALSYPNATCAPAPCCFEYVSIYGPTCHCDQRDEKTCNATIDSYDGTKRASCP
jgi:hypothetical protein